MSDRQDKTGILTEGKLHEECGVFGIYHPPGKNAARDIYYGLTALQHRGQESAGISVSDTKGAKGNILTRKGMGLVSEVFRQGDLTQMTGNIGVGHVRYSTTGGSTLENAQPISMNYIKGSLALVHNGNITNAAAVKEAQMYRGQAHYTTSDSEVLAYEIISKRVKTSSVEQAVLQAVSRLRGGYAVIVMSPRKLVGIRDPYGIKPLILGKKEFISGEKDPDAREKNYESKEKDPTSEKKVSVSYILASESAAVYAVGGEILRDVEPGEIITITEEGLRSDRSLCGRKPAHCVFEYIYFARADSVIDGIEVRSARFRAGQALARRSEVEADIVAGVPDSGLAAAEGYAFESGLPFTLAFHKNSYVGRSFIKPTIEERRAAVQMKLSVLGSVVRGKRVILIDDSIVRGTTMGKIVEMLREAGATEVHVCISSPPFLYPCYYGTDVPDRGQLIATEHATDEICKQISADSLHYLQIEDFSRMLGDLPVCAACFDQRYPV